MFGSIWVTELWVVLPRSLCVAISVDLETQE